MLDPPSAPGERPGPPPSPETRQLAAGAGREGPGAATRCSAPRTDVT